MNRTESVVSVVKGDDIEPSIRSALELIGGIQTIIHPGQTVMIKPNFAVNVPPESGIITDPDVIDVLVKICKEANPAKLMVAESTVVGFDSSYIFKELGLPGRFEKLGAACHLAVVAADDPGRCPYWRGLRRSREQARQDCDADQSRTRILQWLSVHECDPPAIQLPV